ncbi:hypothetical protein G6031_09535 [Dietzia sp. CQ4]|uniref:hypothetical protein n=1 Tax=Dietzia sp. (strain CQ4) TaxID=370437 RepID=UPI0015FA7DB0|nr:hypothetical protein [Dietzia sp. CQ4]MBB1034629.1 hypothetical protein [Dietzia sp. CQ4]
MTADDTTRKAAEVLNAEGACCGDCGREPGAPLSECPACERFLTGYARALDEAGLLAPAPLTEEVEHDQLEQWGTAEVIMVDARRRWVTDWFPAPDLVNRAEGDGRAVNHE